MKNLTINIKGHIVEVLHKNGKHLTFSIDIPDVGVKSALRQFPLKDRLAYFNEHGTMKGY